MAAAGRPISTGGGVVILKSFKNAWAALPRRTAGWFARQGAAAGSGADFAVRTGSTFAPAPHDPYQTPRVRRIPIPGFSGADAIWGATGRDQRGHIWFAVSADGGDHSAHVFEYDPARDRPSERGDVLSNLKAAGRHRDGEKQIKIHSRFVPADDGYLYFASTDEEGEAPDGSAGPTWGSHLWRLRPGENRWEHLHSVPEGLTAVAGGGRWIYALGLWDHVLYQHDTVSGALRRVVVGSLAGHMSRNLVADLRGHVFVPRLRQDAAAPTVSLVEFDPDLREIGATPLADYLGVGPPGECHGIVGLVYLADGSMAISTHVGGLYRITPQAHGAARVDALGPINPASPDYAASLFTADGERYLASVTRKSELAPHETKWYGWWVYDLATGRARGADFPFDGEALIYGSITRDRAGRFYAVGRHRPSESERSAPLFLQIDIGG